MKSNNMFSFIKDIIPVKAMKEGDDFEIISFFTFEHDTQKLTPPDISDIHFNSIEEALLTSCVKGGNMSLVRTPFNPESALYFYRLSSKINYTLAISLGFGIVKLTNSNRPNNFLLYYFNDLDNEEQMVQRLNDQWFLLKCYLQLTEEGLFHEPKLEIYIEENKEHLLLLIHGNPSLLLKKILMAVDKYKGELIILQSKL